MAKGNAKWQMAKGDKTEGQDCLWILFFGVVSFQPLVFTLKYCRWSAHIITSQPWWLSIVDCRCHHHYHYHYNQHAYFYILHLSGIGLLLPFCFSITCVMGFGVWRMEYVTKEKVEKYWPLEKSGGMFCWFSILNVRI